MKSPFEEAQKLTNLWTDFATKMATASTNIDAEQSPCDAAANIRGAALSAMAQYAQQFMRSDQFLELMKSSMDASIAWQRQMTEFLTKAHHASESVAKGDVDDLHRAVRHLEQRTLDRLEQLAEKLDQITDRIETLEARNKDSNGRGSRIDKIKDAPAGVSDE